MCTLWLVFYQAVGGDGGKDKNKEGKVEEVVFTLTCWWRKRIYVVCCEE